MKAKVLTRINVLIGMLLAMLGFGSCEQPLVKYGIPSEKYGPPVDSTIYPMYGVPSPGYVMPQTDDSNGTELEDAPVEQCN